MMPPMEILAEAPEDYSKVMYRIERGEEVSPARWAYTVGGTPLGGVSRQPLLDACRQLKSLYGSMADDRAGVFRAGHDEADISCPVMAGADLTVDEGGRRPRFVKWEPFRNCSNPLSLTELAL
jgi:hypothetical protein